MLAGSVAGKGKTRRNYAPEICNIKVPDFTGFLEWVINHPLWHVAGAGKTLASRSVGVLIFAKDLVSSPKSPSLNLWRVAGVWS